MGHAAAATENFMKKSKIFKFFCSQGLAQGVNVGQIVDKSGQTAVRARLLKNPEILASALVSHG